MVMSVPQAAARPPSSTPTEFRACPVTQVRPIAEDEMFKVMRFGKRQKKQWKRMVTKPTFVGTGFTRKPPKYERFIRPSGERPDVAAGIAQFRHLAN